MAAMDAIDATAASPAPAARPAPAAGPAAPVRLDPAAADKHAENALLRELGAAVEVELPDGVRAWAIPRHQELHRLLSDPRVGKTVGRWAAFARGEVPPTWPLIGFVVTKGMINADGDAHRRLRGLVGQVFTARRIEALRPRVRQIVDGLLDALAEAAPGPVDLRERFAYPLPMGVISELLGVPEERRDELHRFSVGLTTSTTGPEEELAAQRGMREELDALVAAKRRSPGDDLTSALIAAGQESDRLDGEELVGTLTLLVVAGHSTTLNLITNAIRALATHPGQLALVRSGAVPWSAAVEETLRWDAPVNQFPMRYALEDIEVGGVVIRKGEAILASYGSAGRDPAAHGADAGRFDVTREQATRHLAFSHGPHFCLGAPLARMEAEIALEALFGRFPGLRLAEAPEQLVPLPSLISNGTRTLPVLLH
jgi:2-hydroxy-5-methyl-1-naphthoate 7-hydroxylase